MSSRAWPTRFAAKGKLAESEQAIREALALQKKAGVTNSTTGWATAFLADLLYHKGDTAVLKREANDPERINTIKAADILAPSYAEAGRLANWVRLISTTPASPANLQGGEPLQVKLQYSVGEETNLDAWINLSGPALDASRPFVPESTIWHLSNNTLLATFIGSGVDVDKLAVVVRGGYAGEPLAQAAFPVKFHWETAPPVPRKEMVIVHASESNSVSIISITPDSPAALHLNERITLKIRYSCKTRAVRLWVMAQNKGRQVGAFTNGSLDFTSISGRGETDHCQFGCQYWTDVDEVEVTMVDAESHTELARTSMPIEAHWK